MMQRSWRLSVAVLGAAIFTLAAGLPAAEPAAGQPPLPAGSPAAASAAASAPPAEVAPAPAAAAVAIPEPPPELVPDPSAIRGLDDAGARRVRREGIVVRPFNVQAPSFYALKARDSGRIINFLMTTRAEPLNWREFRGKVVIVSGREYLDRRPFWKGIPLLNVDTIEAIR